MSAYRNILYLDDFLALDCNMPDVFLDPQEFYGLDGTAGFIELADGMSFQTITAIDRSSDLLMHPVAERPVGTGDMYKPRKIRGAGKLREGYCEMCNLWFKLKTSSYWYHMNYKHGINSKGIRYPEPQIRYTEHRAEGFCIACNDWIVLGHKAKGRSTKFGWFKHCQKRHSSSKAV
ncbi:hypothetical protein [Encephalitozoon cuniculi GB-M1]|uniref:Transcription regulator Rua1 C-terminal domain-containing protein n=1 Tax=Encephalitozoon cuniculi (strain GB-M1) TaxID=284813 RepID=Q8SW64_ENCCU|nr:uncharacterized protein ECU03_0350 [Encephalitozoon cuniculi GB-M1]CAD26182.1 hypothetical protein [Encephalitozoon cuniculi GB-M1]